MLLDDREQVAEQHALARRLEAVRRCPPASRRRWHGRPARRSNAGSATRRCCGSLRHGSSLDRRPGGWRPLSAGLACARSGRGGAEVALRRRPGAPRRRGGRASGRGRSARRRRGRRRGPAMPASQAPVRARRARARGARSASRGAGAAPTPRSALASASPTSSPAPSSARHSSTSAGRSVEPLAPAGEREVALGLAPGEVDRGAAERTPRQQRHAGGDRRRVEHDRWPVVRGERRIGAQRVPGDDAQRAVAPCPATSRSRLARAGAHVGDHDQRRARRSSAGRPPRRRSPRRGGRDGGAAGGRHGAATAGHHSAGSPASSALDRARRSSAPATSSTAPTPRRRRARAAPPAPPPRRSSGCARAPTATSCGRRAGVGERALRGAERDAARARRRRRRA